MKKTMKRWLAMLLAVLMVMGTLPTSAWAARREEEFAEQPVIGEGDGVTDTLGRHDEGEFPVDPVDPSAPPVEELAVKDHVASISKNENGHFLQVVFDNIQAEGTFTVALLPNFRLGRSDAVMPSTFAESDAETTLNSNSDIGGTWSSYLSLYPLVALPHNTSENYTGMTFTWAQNGTMTLGTQTMSVIAAEGKTQAGSMDNITNLASWYNTNTQKIFDKSGTELSNPTSLPFKVFMVWGDNSFIAEEIDLPVTAQPLKVEILPKLAESMNYFGSEDDPWEYAIVRVTNQSGGNMSNVKVQLNRQAVTTTDPEADWGNITVNNDEDGKAPYDEPWDSSKLLGGLYGFEDGAADDVWGSVTRTETIPNGEYRDFPICLTDLSYQGEPFGKVDENDDTIEIDFWSNYTAVATGTMAGGGTATASANGGIHWAPGNAVVPRIRLVDNNGNPISVYDTSGNANPHTVIVGVTTLTYMTTGDDAGLYTTADGSKVELGSAIAVDSASTVLAINKTVKSAAVIDVPMCKVTVTDTPDGSVADDTMGSWRSDGGYKDAVFYNYYAPGDTVTAFAPTPGLQKMTYGMNGAELTTNQASGEGNTGRRFTVGNADETIYAHYNFVKFVFATTLGGKNLAEGDDGNWNTDHIYDLRIYQDTNSDDNYLARAWKTVNGTDLEDNKTDNLTAQGFGVSQTQAWEITLEGGHTYSFYLNGEDTAALTLDLTKPFTPDKPSVERPDVNYIFEMAGVTPDVTGGSNLTQMLIEDDGDPRNAAVDGYVTVPHTAPEAGRSTYYYRVDRTLGPILYGTDKDVLKTVTYPSDAVEVTTGDSDEAVDPPNTDITKQWTPSVKVLSGTANPLVATFGASDGTAKVTVVKDAGDDQTPLTGLTVRLSSSDTAVSGDGVKVIPLKDTETPSGVYSATAGLGKYYIWIGDACTGQELTVTAGDPPSEATVQYWTVSVTTDGNGKATVTANDKKDLVVGGATNASKESSGTAASIVVIEGTKVTWAFGDPADYYEADKWEGGANHNAITATVGTDTVKSQKALFKQKMANVTVTVNLNDQPKGVGKAVKVTVNGVEKTVAADANETAAVLTFSVPERAAGYTVTVDGAPEDWSTGPVYAPTGEDRPSNADVNFYSLTVEADQTLASSAKVGQSTTDPATADQNSSSVNYLTGTTVYIKAVPGGDNYAFSEWEVQDSKGSKPDPDEATTSVTMTTETHLKAIFTKPRYDTYLVLNLNGDPVKNQDADNMGKPKDEDISKIEFIQTKGDGTKTTTPATFDTEKDAWTVNVISANGTGEWSITTTTGTYTANSAGDSATPTTKNLYSVIVVPDVGKGNDAVGGTNVPKIGDNKLRAILETSGNVALAANPKTGYDFSKWVVVSNYGGDSEAEADITAGGTYAAIENKLTFTSYTANAELVLRPKFTFKATVKVVYDGKPHTADSIELKTGGGSVTSKSENEFTNLVPGTTYNVWVNGFDTGVDISAPATETITMRKISVAKLPTDATATVQIKLGAGSYVTDGAVYVPHGVTVTTNAPAVSIKATENDDYKLDTTAWTVESDGDVAAITTATDAETTVVSATDKKITADVVATAHFTRQYDLTTYVSNGSASIDPRSNSKFEGGTGNGTASGSANTKTIAKDTYVKVTFTGGPGETLDSWTLAAGGAGKWYAGDTPDAEGATWTDWATTAPTKAVESFYFKPSADSTITAAVKTKPYPVKITVKLDGSDLTDETTTVPVVKVNNQTLTYSDGAWTGMFTPGDYALTVGSVINTTTQTLTNIEFSVEDGEGTGTAANLTRTVKYWTVGVETDGHGAATMSSTNPVQSKTVNATTTSDTIRVLEGTKVTWADSTPVTNYVFDKWQEKGTDGSYSNATPTADGIDAQHTYKANFKQKLGTVTVTVKLDGNTDDQSSDVDADAALHTVTLYQGSTVVGTAQTGKSGSYSFTNVPYNEGGTKYHVTVVKSDAVTGAQTYTALTDTAGKDIIFSGDNGGTKNVDAPYFTAIAATEGNGNASINFGGDDGTTKKTDYTDNSKMSVSFVVASGTQVTWQAHEDKANYTFDKWTEDNSTAAKRENVAVTSANKTFTAKFKKDAFNTYLYLTVNGDPYGETATDGTKDIQSVELVTAKTTTATAVVDLDGNAITPTYDDTTKVWKAEGVKSEGQNAYWRVKTVDGGVYFKDANTEDKNNDVALDLANNKAVVREPLFGVVIERGAGNDTTATYTPTLKAQTGSEAKTRIVTEAEVAATVDLNKKSGYTWSKWLSKQSASPVNTDDLDTTNHGKSTTTTTADGTFALVKGYTAPATGDDKDLHIKPVYTFTTTIVTKYKTDPTDVTTVQINDGTTTTTVNKETAGTGNHTGRYTASGLDPEKTYTIIVNGFPSTVTCDKNNAGADVDVTIFKVTVEKKDKKNNTLTPDGSAYVKLGANATGASATFVYLPIGAKTTTGETDVTKVNLTAAEKAASPLFRLYNKDVAVDATPADEILWDAAFTAPAGKTMTAAIATNTGTQTPNNLTIGGDDGMQADVTVTAYFLRQYDLTVSAVTTEDKAATNSEVKLTADPKGLGTVMPGTATGQSVKVTKVDAKTYIKAEYVHGVGEDFKGWSYAEADGDLYSALKEDGTVDTTKRIAPAALTAPGGKENTTVYFVPKTDGAVLKAVVEPAKYTVQVKVNLDNTDYPYNNGDLKVWLYTDETTPKKVTELTYNTTDKAFKGEVYPGTYRVYVNGADLANDPVFTEAAKNISFTADEAEGTVAGGGATGKAKLKKEINYYTVNLKADPAGTVPAQNKISFEAITDAKPGATTASKIFLAKAAGYNIDIYSKVYAGRGATDTVHYRFVDWTETATAHGFADKDAGNTAYKFPAENTLVADTANIDGAQEGKQLTLTANFKEQYKVTVKLGTELASNAFGVQIKNEGDTNWASDAYVYVDKDKSVVINGKSNGGGVENSDSYLSEWTIEGDAATDFGAYDNSYLAGTNDTAAAETDKGYKIQGGKYTPKRDSVLVLNGWQKPLLDSGWVFDKGTGAETSPKGEENGERTSLWTKRDAQETPTKVIVRGVTNASYSKEDFTEGIEYGRSADKTKFTFDVENYLKDLPNGTYALVFEYTLGGENHPNSATREVTNTRNFIIKANKNKLTDVNIQVKGHPGETANPVEATTRNAVEYVPPHKAEKIDYADLTFTWYWSANNPGNTAETTYEDDSDMTAAGAKSAADKANAAAAAKGVLVSTLAIKPTVSDWTKDGNTVANGVTSVTDSMKGGYLFAVVTTPDGSEVSTGAVITNAISVDYDAKITLRQDGTAVTDAKAGGYAVYLWPTTGGAFDVTNNKAVQATHVTGADNDGVNSGIYSTKGSKLNANTDYHIYVLETEGMAQNVTANYIQWKNGSNPVVISRTTTPPTYVDYYTVSVTDMSAGSTFTHATTAAQANDPAAAETFTTYPTFIVTTPKGATINTAANAKGVLKGTAISVKANALKDKTVGWDQDYTLAWQDKEGAETAFTDAASKLTQSSTNAVSTGYAYTNSLANKVDFTGRLTQNTYTIEGDVKDVGGKAINAGGGAIATATLTAAAATYNGTLTPAAGGHGAKVAFTVPRAAAEAYTLTATPTDGTSGTPETTMKGYSVPSATAATTEDSVKLDEVAAGTTGNALKNRFTIFVAATELKMKVEDGDNTEGHHNESSNRDAYVSAGHAETWVYANYTAWEKTITVTNTGNTELAVTLVLQKSTDGGTNWTDIYKTGTELGGTGKDTDTNGVQFVGLEDTFNLGLADDNKSKSFKVKVPETLENKDDVKYRFDFVTKDGRGGADPVNGPKMYFNLDLTIEPVTIRRVTTWNDDGTFKVQHHWLKEDAVNLGQPDTDATYNAGGEAHTYAAETLGTGHTIMDDLVKQGQNVDGDVATADPTKSDIKYRWYVADADAEKPTINTTTGELTFPGNKGHEVTADVDSNGTAYTPTAADHGKMLYLVAVGQRNATNAVMTPDKDTFHEDPVPIPYPATIRLFENKVNRTSGASERTQVSKDDGEKYEVWLWDTANGDFPENPSANGSKAIKATATEETVDGNAYSKYVTDVILYPDHNYQVWTSAAKKVDTAFYPKYTNITIDSVDHKDKDVDYYLVDVANTELSQNDYDTELTDDNIVANSQYFYKNADLTGDLEKPSAKMPAEGETAATLDVVNNYVLNNTEVTFGFGDRTLDYDLNWGGGMTAVTDKPTDTVSHKLTYKDAAKAAVTTELELRLYDVKAYVMGTVGYANYITMTLSDTGDTKYVFTTRDQTGEILAIGTPVTQINVSNTDYTTFRLPKANGYATVADVPTGDAAVAELLGYRTPHNNGAPSLDAFSMDVNGVANHDTYDVVLQGEGQAMTVQDDVNDDTKLDTGNASVKGGIASISGDEVTNLTGDKAIKQQITLNYNYGKDQFVTVNVTNTSKQDPMAAAVVLENVTFAAAGTGNSAATEIELIENTFTTPIASFGADDTGHIKLKIHSGLAVGEYHYSGTFSFMNDADADVADQKTASATYDLTVIVEPLTFNSVDITKNDDGTLIIDPAADKQYTVTRKKTAEDGENPDLTYRDLPNTTTTDPDANSKLVQDTDYGYQWISAPVGTTDAQVKAALTWNNGTLTVGNANGVTACTGTDATQKVYTPKDADSGRNLFLVIYGKDNADGARRNATSFAVSPAQTNTYKGMVALKVDDAEKRGKDDADSADTVNKPNDGDGYEVWFISKNDATDKTKATWTKVDDEYAYVADLLPNDNGYSVEISRAKDDSKKVTLTGATITGTNVKTTIDTTGSNVVEAPFFTVNALAFVNKEYQTGTGEDFTGVSITPTVTIGTDHAELANHTPVLSGQTVAAKAPAMAAPNADKAWTQDYTLTWRQKSDDNDAGTGTTVTDTDLTDTTTKGQSATAAIADGAYAFGEVSAKTFIGGRLDQITYTIVGTIHGPTGNTHQQVKNVTLTSDTTPAVIYYSDANTAGAGQTGIQSGVWTKDNNDGKHNDGDQVTFTVVKGTYTVTGYEDTNFTIRKVTVEGTDVDSTPRNQKVFTKDVKELDANKRVFDIYLEATGPKLTVNDKVTTTITATSELPDHNHQFADNNSGAHYYYKQLGSDGVFTLELSNPGNVDLKLKAPEVYKLDTGTTYTDMQAALTGKTALTNLTVKDGTRDIVKFENLPAANDDVLVGKSVSHGGTTLANAGTITVSKDVYNKDDAIYVVKFASEYLTTDGAPAVTGPTVYYVLDLQVEPLPIKKVTAETDPNATDGTLRLKDFVATGDNANDGLNSVLVDHDRDNDPDDLMGAKTAGLVDADISYVWYSAPTDKTVNAADFQFNATSGALELSAAATGKDLKLGLNANTGKTYTPTDAEQGRNFYLVAYRTDATKNASEFAVSDAVYAQVTIAMKAYRTGKVNKSDTEATPLLTEVNISTMVGETKKISNDDTVTVTSVANNANVLTFNATKTDVIAAGATDDDPAAAKWYFKSWAVKPLTGDELNATDTSIETPVGGERLTMNYTATGKAIVIGYFDKLPELSGSSGCTIGSATIPETSRTLEYKHHDGSGNIQIWVMPKPDEAGTNKFKSTGVEGEDLTSPRPLNATAFEKIAGSATGSMGGDGAYVLLDSWVKGTLEGDMDYIFTFYDMDEGEKAAADGYAGYDRSHNYATSTGDKSVTAVVADANKGQGHTVQVTNTSTDPTKPDGAIAETSTAQTNDAVVTLHANPKDGYAFVGWTVTEGDGTFQDADGKGNTRPETVFRPRTLNVTVTATFRKGDFTPQADTKTSVYYGDDELQETDGKLVVSVTKDKDTSVTQNFSYALATEAELTTYLNGAARPANAYTTDGVEVVPGDATQNTNVVPEWLAYAVDGGDNTKVNFTVKANTPATGVNVQKTTGEDGKLKDREDELVVYLKVTETHTGESKLVPVTINVMTSDLKIKTANSDDEQQKTLDGNAYLALFEAATNATYPGEGRKPDHEEKVYYDYFAYQNVHNKHNPTGNVVDTNDQTGAHAANAAGANRWDKTDGALNADYGVVSNGYWTVAPVAFDGTGPNGYVAGQENTNDHDYKFTFHYTGDPDDDADNYNYNDAEITLTIPALVPEMSLKFADTLKTTTQGGDPKALLTLTKGTHSGEVTGDGYVKDDADNHAPISLAYANEANRKDEHLTYLDEEPVFHVTLQKIGNLKRVELSAADVDGFETELPTITIDPNATTQTAEFDVKLTHMKDNAKLWAGTHTIKITAKGYYDDATGAEKFITATYELEIVIDPRLITAVDVTTEYDETKPTDVTPTIEGDPTLNEKGEDTKGNTPIKDAAVTWETEDAKNPVPVKETVTVEIDPNYKIVPDDIKPETELNGKNDKDTPESADKNPDPNTEVTPEAPAEDKTDGGKITITQLHPILMFNDQKEGDDNSKAGPAVNHVRHLTSVKVGSDPTALGKVLIDLGAYSSDVYDVDVEVKFNDFAANGGVLTPALPEGQLLWPQIDMIAKDGKTRYVMDLTGLDTSKAMNYVLRLEAKGTEKDGGAQTILASYELHLRVTPNSPPPSGPSEPACPCKVFYHVGLHGVTADATVEDVSESNRPSKIPTVTALDGYAFRGWSLTNPATLKQGEKIELVDPKTVTVKGDAMTFYAVIVERPFHEHYVIGYPNGNFGPADNINRASVATIIARAILPDFVEGANYGNPGGYSDVSGHWAESAIAYCSKFDVFKGYTDGTFRPDQPITRQEFATVIARLDGELTAKDIPFDDIDEAGDWAMNGIYTSYEKGWVNGYTDGTFKPLNNIRRDEAVKVFNAYLNRGVDADGLSDLHEYIHSGTASNNTGNGVDEYMTWSDVPKDHWAYYEIVEAANDHEYTPDFDAPLGYTLPEHWEKCWIDARWRYSDNAAADVH